MLAFIGGVTLLSLLTYVLVRYTCLASRLLEAYYTHGACPAHRHAWAQIEDTYRRLRILQTVYIVIAFTVLYLLIGELPVKFLQTNLGNALAYGVGTFLVLCGIAGGLWLLGQVTGGN